MAKQVLGGPASWLVSVKAATIIVRQFMHDLLEVGVMKDLAEFQGARADVLVHGTCTTGDSEDYFKWVFVEENFPVTMSVKSCLTMSGELGLLDLRMIYGRAKQLLCQVKTVPRAQHTRGT